MIVPALRARGLCYGYLGRSLAPAFDLDIHPGEVVAVLGPNGAGKSTLIRTLLGLHPPLAGEIWLAGSPLVALEDRVRAQMVSYVPQSIPSGLSFPVLEMVLMGRASRVGLFSTPGARDHHAALQALQEVHMAELADKSFDALSGGEQRLVLIARALAQESPLLILDEPAAHLDVANQALVLGIIRGLATEARAVMYSTHDPSHTLEGATHALLIGQGRQPKFGTASLLLEETCLTALYGASMESLRDAAGQVAAFRVKSDSSSAR